MTPPDIHDESHLKVLRIIEAKPNINQRELAQAVGVSLGKLNYCIKALLQRGHVKMQNFRTSQNKLSYYYLLTPSGMAAKADITTRFLKRKMAEYEALQSEIELLQAEVNNAPSRPQA